MGNCLAKACRPKVFHLSEILLQISDLQPSHRCCTADPWRLRLHPQDAAGALCARCKNHAHIRRRIQNPANCHPASTAGMNHPARQSAKLVLKVKIDQQTCIEKRGATWKPLKPLVLERAFFCARPDKARQPTCEATL